MQSPTVWPPQLSVPRFPNRQAFCHPPGSTCQPVCVGAIAAKGVWGARFIDARQKTVHFAAVRPCCHSTEISERRLVLKTDRSGAVNAVNRSPQCVRWSRPNASAQKKLSLRYTGVIRPAKACVHKIFFPLRLKRTGRRPQIGCVHWVNLNIWFRRDLGT